MKYLIKERGENLLGKWTVNFEIGKDFRYLGKLFVTDKALYFDAQYDTSLDGLLENIGVSAGVGVGASLLFWKEIVDQWKKNGVIEIPKSEIRDIKVKTSLINKRVIMTMKDATEVVVDYGMLSVKKIAKAIEA